MIGFPGVAVSFNAPISRPFAFGLVIKYRPRRTEWICKYGDRYFHLSARRMARNSNANSSLMEKSNLTFRSGTDERLNRRRKGDVPLEIDLEQVLNMLEEDSRNSLIDSNEGTLLNANDQDERLNRLKLLDQILGLPLNISERVYFLLPEERTRVHRSNKFANSFINEISRLLKESGMELYNDIDWDALKEAVKTWMTRSDLRRHSEFCSNQICKETKGGMHVDFQSENHSSNSNIFTKNVLINENGKLKKKIGNFDTGNVFKDDESNGDAKNVNNGCDVRLDISNVQNDEIYRTGGHFVLNNIDFEIPDLVFSDLYKIAILSVPEDATREEIELGISQVCSEVEVGKVEFFYERAGKERRKNAFVSVKTKEQCDAILNDSVRCFGIYIRGQRSPILDAFEKRALLLRASPPMNHKEICELLRKLGLDQDFLSIKMSSIYSPPIVGKRLPMNNVADIFVPISSSGKPMGSSYLTFVNHNVAYTAFHSLNRCQPSSIKAFWTQKKHSLLEQVIRDRDVLARENMALKSKLKSGFYVNRSLKEVINSHIENVYEFVGKDVSQAARILSISRKRVLDAINSTENDKEPHSFIEE